MVVLHWVLYQVAEEVELQKLDPTRWVPPPVPMVEKVVKVIILQSQEYFKSSVQEAVVVEELIVEQVELAQELVVILVETARQTEEVAVVVLHQVYQGTKAAVVVVELWLLVMILQILCL